MANGEYLRTAEANGYSLVCFNSHDDYDGCLVTQYYVRLAPACGGVAAVLAGVVDADMDVDSFDNEADALARFDELLLTLGNRPRPKEAKTKSQIVAEFAREQGVSYVDLPLQSDDDVANEQDAGGESDGDDWDAERRENEDFAQDGFAANDIENYPEDF